MPIRDYLLVLCRVTVFCVAMNAFVFMLFGDFFVSFE